MGPWSLLLLLALSIAPALALQTTCTNQNLCLVSCEGCTGQTTIPDPQDCRRFYYCDGEQLLSEEPFNCPDGQVYNTDTHECQVDSQWLECSPPCPPTPAECHYTCLNNDSYIASAYDCGTYYTCNVDGTSSSAHSCPSEAPFFDGHKCQADETLCCHCQGYCYPGDEGRLVQDPSDCRNYHVCLAVGVPANSGTCDEGEHFDPLSRKCSSEAPCRTMCINMADSEGCIENFTCFDDDDHAKCPKKCDKEYYKCNGVNDEYAEVSTCSGSYVFVPEYGYCTYSSNCDL